MATKKKNAAKTSKTKTAKKKSATKKGAKKKPAPRKKAKKRITKKRPKAAKKSAKKSAKKTAKKTAKKAPRAAPRKRAASTPAPAKVSASPTTVATGMKGVPDGKSAVSTPASTKPMWQKLHVKGGFARSMNVPAGYEDVFAGSPAQPASGNADTVHLWVTDHAELEAHLATATAAVNEGGMLIISYPKGRADIHRDTLWKAVGAQGWEAVALVAVDDTWSAMRFKRK
jgi:hypothetical protein